MTNVKLITTETFGNLPCNFYCNMNNDILLTREQIGQALEYSDPIKAIQKIHLKHKDRLDELSVRIKGSTQIGGDLTKSEEQERVYYTERGIMEICRWSRQAKANLFMDWIWDIIEKYRHNELQPDMKSLTDTLSSITQTLTTLTQTMTTMNQEINEIKQQSITQPKQIPKKNFSYWSTKMFPKYQLLTDYFNISNRELYKELYREFTNTYPDIDLNQIVDDYCYENKLETCFTLDAIEHNRTVRQLYELMVDNILSKYNLSEESTTTKYKTIFDN